MRNQVAAISTAFGLICLLLAAGCEKENKIIKIATQSPLSGSQSVFGADVKNGAQLAVEHLAEPLTKMGFTVQIAPFDDQANPDTGVANAKAIVADPQILGVVAHVNSGVMIPSSEEYHSANLCSVSPATTNPRVTMRGHFDVNRVCGRDDIQGGVGAQFVKNQGCKSVWVMGDKTAGGQGVADQFQKKAVDLGLKVLGATGTEEKLNFDALLSPVLAAKPDCIYFGGSYDQIAVFFKQARQKGFKGMCISDDAFDSPDAARIGGEPLIQGAGTFYSEIVGPASAYPNTAKFITDFKAEFNNVPNPYAVMAYDCAGVLLKGIENAAKDAGNKMPTRENVCKAVRALQNYQGLSGNITFNKNGDPINAKYFIMQVASADPAKWSDNKISQSTEIHPPE